MLVDNPEGITYLDFPPEHGITEGSLAQAIKSLEQVLSAPSKPWLDS
jgi:hypothetical protein